MAHDILQISYMKYSSYKSYSSEKNTWTVDYCKVRSIYSILCDIWNIFVKDDNTVDIYDKRYTIYIRCSQYNLLSIRY